MSNFFMDSIRENIRDDIKNLDAKILCEADEKEVAKLKDERINMGRLLCED